MQKLLIIPLWYPGRRSSIGGIFIEDQAVALSQTYDVTVVAPELITWKVLLFDRGAIVRGFEDRNGVKVYRYPIPLFPKLSTISILLFFAWFTRSVFARILASRGTPDIIHAHGAFPAGLLGLRLGKKYGIPVVLTEHSGPFAKLFTSNSKKRIIDKVIAGVDRMIAVSPALARQITAFYPSRSLVIVGNIIRTDIFSPPTGEPTRSGSASVLFFVVAILYKTKGIDYLLEAARILLAKGIHNFEIIVGGDGPYLKNLRKNAEKMGLVGHYRFTGLLQRDQVKEHMQRCDVFVMPSLGETFCVALAEAMSCGKPVIATRCGGPEFFIDEECGVLVEMADAEALAGAMAGFIERKRSFDPVKIRIKIENRFGKAAFLKNISEIYRALPTLPESVPTA
jgi:glycosyltransferase involved in cell wall biosynthesis